MMPAGVGYGAVKKRKRLKPKRRQRPDRRKRLRKRASSVKVRKPKTKKGKLSG